MFTNIYLMVRGALVLLYVLIRRILSRGTPGRDERPAEAAKRRAHGTLAISPSVCAHPFSRAHPSSYEAAISDFCDLTLLNIPGALDPAQKSERVSVLCVVLCVCV